MDTVLFQPVYWFREKVVEPMRGEPQAWYHRKYPRVTGIEDCYTEDVVCRSEPLGLCDVMIDIFSCLQGGG